jgi:hypothetical protein
MIRRYNLSHPVGQPMPEDWIHLPDSVVAAADYDALAARLAEAEQVVQIVRENRNGVYDGTAALMLVRNADSAVACCHTFAKHGTHSDGCML